MGREHARRAGRRSLGLRRRTAGAALLAALMLVAVVGHFPVGRVAPAAATGSVPSFDHIFVIMLENEDFSDIIGNPDLPYINSLAASGASLQKYYAVAHPSLPNYLALTGGSTFGLDQDCDSPSCYVGAASNIAADRIEPSGRTWKAYMESMPVACDQTNTDLYAVRHNPFLYYDDIRTVPSECNKDVPYTQLATDLQSAATTPNFGWITPNLCDDAHDCPATSADTWLQANVPAILSSPAFTTQHSLLAVTFDEDDHDGSCPTAGETSPPCNQIPTILVGSGIAPGTVSKTQYDDYSLLKTIETSWSLPPLTDNDEDASPISDVFTATGPPGQVVSRGAASAVSYASDSTTSLSLGVPSGAVVGDVLVASLGFGKTGAGSQPVLTAPAGWTLVSRTNDGTDGALAVFTHVLASGESSFAWTTNVTVGGSVFLAAFGGVDPSSPVDGSAGQGVSGSGLSFATPSVTTSGASDVLVGSFFAYDGGGSGASWSPPSGMTELGDSSNGASRSGALDEVAQSAAGASGAKTATASASQDYAITSLTALRPAPVTEAPGVVVSRGAASAVSYASDSTTSLSLGVPSGAVVGDVLVASLGFGKTGAGSQPVLTAPAGWTLVSRTNDGTDGALAVFTHVLASGESSFAWTTNVTVGGSVFLAAFGGVDPSSPVDGSAGQGVSGSGLSFATPSVTTSGASDVLVGSFFAYDGGGSGASWSPPSGMTELGDSSNGASRSGALDEVAQSAAGASGAKTATASASQDYAITSLTALRPAPVATTTTSAPSTTTTASSTTTTVPTGSGPNDTFSTNSLDPAKWVTAPSGSTIAAANQELEIAHPAVVGWTDGNVQTAASYNQTGKSVQVQLVAHGRCGQRRGYVRGDVGVPAARRLALRVLLRRRKQFDRLGEHRLG